MKTSTHLWSIALTTAVVTFGSTLAIADDDEKVSLENIAVSMEQATAIALEQVAGTAVGAEVESEDGKLIWEVEVQNENGEIYEVEIDAVTATVLEVELDD